MRDARTAEVMEHPLVKKAFELFPGAELTAIRDAEEPAGGEPASDSDEDDD